ncbi:asparagine synthase [Xanthomonas phaseoli pv. phaseoli]|uniref:asparagine synthase (glutamine-hydrolyzing) n=1 Tax=Xanthomonas phaseoli TaxID=1985254 RepID=UPI000536A2C1|nr:asparagine synthase (glutamine-hydrolyzing) [Xanthomonas phaseoli]KGU55607.1 asparagine synthase [Xanthomonas phaseoli pv. phaseoli]KHF49375.1 asparagine synthase [Xanthomonas phaseoli pv. phaseoli]KHS07213.1 asparagine synthase [Xanthomonas phaseoli pv. phaseoli]KHS27272.1 asparagine synthase [Xanthomonas phaseoli pv. phaseoli]
MCGIVALRSFVAEAPLQALAERALDALSRRGPDAQGLLCLEQPVPTALGHRRLAILDLSAAATQPMRCAETGNVLVFNGEIYNFLELRRELEALGHQFRTDSDTEVILHGWRAWGEGLFPRCNGMWALVLLEQASGDLIYCRDRLGVKPLYLHHDGRQLVLASEIRAIAASLGGYPPPNPAAVFDFLVTGLSDHTTETFYAGIRAVPPGWLYRVSPAGHSRRTPYHQWPLPGAVAPLDAQATLELLEDSTRLRLRSDAPTVSLLSGGLDSSILTTLSVQAGALPRTCFAGAFTYGYDDTEQAGFDETEAAASLMQTLGQSERHFVHRARAIPDEEELLALVAAQEEPFCTPSILASFRMYRAIRAAGYKVVLNGEGADELFGGYVRLYLALSARSALHQARLPTAIRLLSTGAVDPRLLLNRLAWDLPAGALGALLRRQRPSVACMSSALWHDQAARLQLLQVDRRVDIEARLRRDVLSTNLPMVLRMTDRNSMSAGIEVRAPFLDYRVVERALSTPALQRMGDYHGKAMLRHAFAERLPARVTTQRKSTGFGHAEQFLVDRMPLQQALATLPEGVNELLNVARLRRELASGRSHSTLWFAVSVALWYRSVYA